MEFHTRAALGFAIWGLSCGTTPPTASSSSSSDAATTSDATAGADAEAGTVPISPFPPDYMSGTRLRARYWLADDGTRQMEASIGPVWYDSKLQTPCTFSQVATGVYVCLPGTLLAATQGASLDPGCTENRLVAIASAPEVTQQTPLMLQWQREVSCAAPPKYAFAGGTTFVVGAALGVTTWYDAQCMPRQVPPGSTLYEIDRALTRDELVAAHVERRDTGHRLVTVELVADDGTHQRIGWYDKALDSECQVSTAVDGKTRCLPPSNDAEVGTKEYSWFADAACTVRVGYPKAGSTPPMGSFVTTWGTGGTCGDTPYVYFRVGAPVEGDLYIGSSANCMNVGPQKGMFRITEVAPTAMDPFEDVIVGGDRLHAIVRKDAEGAVDAFPFGTSPKTVTDGTLMQTCQFGATSDGTTHCLPTWNDEMPGLNCSRKVAISKSPPCGQVRPSYAGAWTGNACTGGIAFSELGPQIPPNGGMVGQCTVGDTPGTFFYEIAADVASSSFVGAKIVIE